MTVIDPANYPSAVAELLRALPLAPLGPGKPQREWHAKLAALDDTAFGRVADRDRAAACRAGLWLAFDYLDESHEISQGLHTAEGSFWHAIMHRREPDAANSKYWFRRVGTHPVLDQLREQAPSLGYKFTDPFAFVDFVERVRDTGTPDEETARKVQLLEWQLLFDWSYRGAIA
jgi:hypothetical protein